MTPFLLMLVIAFPAGETKAKPNTLTTQEAADGWLLLFDGETTFGWKADGQAVVKDGTLVLGGDKLSSIVTTTAFGECELRFECQVEGKGEPNVLLYPKGNWVLLLRGVVGFEDRMGWTEGRVVLSKLKGSKDRVVLQVQLKGPAGNGKMGRGANGAAAGPIRFRTPAGCKLVLRNVKLRPLNAQPLFGGKALTGWKEIPGRKSKFTVTKEGWLNVKDGPGDLQTDGKWADFVLQIDCISNGKHLNSGVFFRCLPGQFWSGYEAQVRNQWQGDRIKPVDFGTGGLYNRQPARKVVSSDKAWFTMTVVTQGKHIAIWVNGYQTVDFTDPRPAAEDARRGAKMDAGPISLQGHDPTTDLSFRNIRIAELSVGR